MDNKIIRIYYPVRFSGQILVLKHIIKYIIRQCKAKSVKYNKELKCIKIITLLFADRFQNIKPKLSRHLENPNSRLR